MSDKPQDWDRSRDEIVSGEYVLGILSEEDRRRVEARIATDPKFAMQVRRWQTNLADFNDDYRDVKPPAELYNRIEARLFGVPDDRPRSGLLQALWGSLALWRGLTAVAIIAAVGFGLAGRGNLFAPPQAARPLVAELPHHGRDAQGFCRRQDHRHHGRAVRRRAGRQAHRPGHRARQDQTSVTSGISGSRCASARGVRCGMQAFLRRAEPRPIFFRAS